MGSAKQIKIVCTRKLDEQIVRKADKVNISLISRDLLEISSKNSVSLLPILLENSDPLIFTSGHAIRAFKSIVDKNQSFLIQTNCFCIEGQTSQAAIEAGFKVRGTGRTGQELAEKIILENIPSVLHCTTAHRRDELQTALEKAGMTYRVLEIYDKKPVPEIFEAFDGVIFYSPSQVDAFLMNNMLEKNIPAFCIGHTTESHLISKGYDNVIVAAQSDTAHILQCVYSYFNK
jgi:uroporphyrinogen-III synthase